MGARTRPAPSAGAAKRLKPKMPLKLIDRRQATQRANERGFKLAECHWETAPVPFKKIGHYCLYDPVDVDCYLEALWENAARRIGKPGLGSLRTVPDVPELANPVNASRRVGKTGPPGSRRTMLGIRNQLTHSDAD